MANWENSFNIHTFIFISDPAFLGRVGPVAEAELGPREDGRVSSVCNEDWRGSAVTAAELVSMTTGRSTSRELQKSFLAAEQESKQME